MPDVIVVLGSSFGERLTPLVSSAPIWIVASEINRLTYEHMWRSQKHTGHGEKDAITSFDNWLSDDSVTALENGIEPGCKK